MKTKLALALAFATFYGQSKAGEFTAKVTSDYPTNSAPLGFKVYLAIGALPFADQSTKVFTVTNGSASGTANAVTAGTVNVR